MSVNVYNKKTESLEPIADSSKNILKDGVVSANSTYSSQQIESIKSGLQTEIKEIADSNYSYIPLISAATDYLTFAESCKMCSETKVRFHGTDMTNNPFGVTSDTDFFVTVQKIDAQDKWITMYAKDVHTNRSFVNTNNNGTWLGWQELSMMV